MNARTAARLGEGVLETLLALCAGLTILTTLAIIVVLLRETASFLSRVSIQEFLTATQWTPLFSAQSFGILPLLFGTLLVTCISLFVAVPAGVLIALFLSEYAPPAVRRIVKPCLDVFAGIPTVVYGFFALLWATPALQVFLPGLSGFNALSPGIVIGVMILPMASSLSENALRAVPQSLREAAYALGSSRLQTSFRVVLPAALSGVTASFLLAFARAVGETMIVSIAAGQQAKMTLNPLEPVQTMTAFILQVGQGDTPAGTVEHQTIFAVGMSLFLITFGVTLLSQALRRRFGEVCD